MRRSKQALCERETEQILNDATSGVLSVLDADGYPYAVPMSFVHVDGCIYFHSARTGHKIDALRHCEKASFCVIFKDDVRPAGYTTHYKSVIAFGRASIVENEAEIVRALRALGEKYRPGHTAELDTEINKCLPALAVIKLEIEQVTGKQAKGLLKE